MEAALDNVKHIVLLYALFNREVPMSRPAGDAEQRLINAGKAILEDTGLSGMSVRAVAARAGVNIGLVSYHFGGKEAFVHRVVLEVYEEFFKDFSLEVEGEKDA